MLPITLPECVLMIGQFNVTMGLEIERNIEFNIRLQVLIDKMKNKEVQGQYVYPLLIELFEENYQRQKLVINTFTIPWYDLMVYRDPTWTQFMINTCIRNNLKPPDWLYF